MSSSKPKHVATHDPVALCEAALASADEAVASGDAASAERWLKVARQATAMGNDLAEVREKTAVTAVALDPAAKLAQLRRRRAAIIAVIGRRLERLAQLPDDQPVDVLPPRIKREPPDQ
jgi:hypothetical protein